MFTQLITPRFCETDALGHISNTTLPLWFEGARNDVFKVFTPDLGLKKWPLILAKIEVDFVGQIFYQFDVEIRTYISRIGGSSFDVYQEAWQQGELKSKGKAIMVHFCYDSQKATPLTEDIKQALLSHQLSTT